MPPTTFQGNQKQPLKKHVDKIPPSDSPKKTVTPFRHSPLEPLQEVLWFDLFGKSLVCFIGLGLLRGASDRIRIANPSNQRCGYRGYLDTMNDSKVASTHLTKKHTPTRKKKTFTNRLGIFMGFRDSFHPTNWVPR